MHVTQCLHPQKAPHSFVLLNWHMVIASHSYFNIKWYIKALPCSNGISPLNHAQMAYQIFAMLKLHITTLPCSNGMSGLCHAQIASHSYAMLKWYLKALPCSNGISPLYHGNSMVTQSFAMLYIALHSFSLLKLQHTAFFAMLKLQHIAFFAMLKWHMTLKVTKSTQTVP